MRHINLVFVGVTLFLALLVTGWLIVGSDDEAAQPGVVISLEAELEQVKADLREQEAVYQNQMAELDIALQQKQATYEGESKKMAAQIMAAQKELGRLQAQEQMARAEIERLSTAQIEQAATYETQIQQTRRQYEERLANLQQELQEMQLKLAQVP